VLLLPPPPLLSPPPLLLPRPVLLRRRCREPPAAVAAAAAFRRGTWLALGMASERMLLEPDIDLPERQKPSNPAVPPSMEAVGRNPAEQSMNDNECCLVPLHE